MTFIEAIALGIIQGLTEFLPISSSGHLELAQHLFGFKELNKLIFFDLMCHLGTLLAVVSIFSSQIKKAFSSDKKVLWQLTLAILPLFPLVLIMKPIKALFDQPHYLGYCFLITALLLFLGLRSKASPQLQEKKSAHALIIGLFQAFAILPGISRSGATISGGRLLGWSQNQAMTFAFLLAIPTILGGIGLELLTVYKGENVIPAFGLEIYLIGLFASFVTGYFTLSWLVKRAEESSFRPFAWYCLLLGIVCIILL